LRGVAGKVLPKGDMFFSFVVDALGFDSVFDGHVVVFVLVTLC
jgi:hypothetical protein